MIQPTFKTRLDYEKANILMQPAFIRVVDNIRKAAESSHWEISYREIEKPFPSYLLSQKKGDKIVETNIWFICFQVCFQDYHINQSEPVAIDNKLINDQGELDWHELENKTQRLVQNIFR